MIASAVSTDSMKQAGFAVATGLYDVVRHHRSNQRARTTLASIERERGATDRRLVAQCDEYAQEVLGSRKYAPWLYVYTAVSGGFKEGWIPDNYYGLVVSATKSDGAAKIVRLKSFTNRILDTEALPDVAYTIDGIYYSRDFRPLREDELIGLLFDGSDRTFFKADDSCQGRSIWILTREDFMRAPRQPPLDAPLPDGVFQAPIRQHPFFDVLSPNSVATLRVTTVRELDGNISLRAAYLRLGRSADSIVRSASHVRVALDRETGVFSDIAFLPDWRTTRMHPDTGETFAGRSVPHFDEAIALAKSLHASCPHMLCIGWDLCIDDHGQPKLMEWNARHNDIKFSEATTGPCFRGLGWENLWRRAAAH